MKNATRFFLFAALLAPLGCGAEDPVPAKPTWVDDVEPILRGNCLHCHGSGAAKTGGAIRFDLYDASDAAYAEFKISEGMMDTLATTGIIGGKPFAMMFVGKVTDIKLASRMPPPPATALSERDIQVLKAWAKTGAVRGKRLANHKPYARLLAEPADASGAFVVSLDVIDDDYEQVIGKATVNGTDVLITGAGAQKLKFPALGNGDPGVTVVLFDGQDRTQKTLKWVAP